MFQSCPNGTATWNPLILSTPGKKTWRIPQLLEKRIQKTHQLQKTTHLSSGLQPAPCVEWNCFLAPANHHPTCEAQMSSGRAKLRAGSEPGMDVEQP